MRRYVGRLYKVANSTHAHKEWLKQMEAQAQARGPTGVRPAKAAFNKLSRPDQLDLLGELVEVRSADLCRVYLNVVEVSIGYKLRYNKLTGKYRIGRIPCVTFLVKKKWSAGAEVNRRQELPKHLFIYARSGRKHQLCAVETDVVDACEYSAVGPQAKQIVVRPEGKRQPYSAIGVITCTVKKTKKSADLYALGCRHVFGISNSNGSGFFYAEVRIKENGAFIGTTVGLRGNLEDNLEFSLDTQACGVRNPNALWAALRNVKLTGYARNNDKVPDSYWIHVANGPPVKARRVSPVPKVHFRLHYKNIGMVVHEQVIEARSVTRPGDSGAPCTTRSTGGVLLGMHFAGPVQPENQPPVEGKVFMIPAWHLLDRSRYQGGGANKLWELIGQP